MGKQVEIMSITGKKKGRVENSSDCLVWLDVWDINVSTIQIAFQACLLSPLTEKKDSQNQIKSNNPMHMVIEGLFS